MLIKTRELKSLLCLCIFVIISACSDQKTVDTVKYTNHVTSQRKSKDSFFKESPESPLLEEQQWKFTNLQYFPIDPSYRIDAKAKPIVDQKPVSMSTSTGHQRLYIPKLILEFEAEGTAHKLVAYQDVDLVGQESTSYFVPFTDLTSGQETNGSGRYIEFDYSGRGLTQLDFNFSYNPYCAYNYNYSCPIPPVDNNLMFAVRAGEMAFRE